MSESDYLKIGFVEPIRRPTRQEIDEFLLKKAGVSPNIVSELREQVKAQESEIRELKRRLDELERRRG